MPNAPPAVVAVAPGAPGPRQPLPRRPPGVRAGRRLEAPAPQRVPPALVELTEAEWARLRPLLPPRRPRAGRPRHDDRTVLGGILWVVRNRASWRDLPLRFGKWERAYKRYRLWSDTGLWERILNALRSATDEAPAEVWL